MAMFSSEPVTANHTRKFEEAYMTGSSFPILGLFQFTRESERDMAGTALRAQSGNTRPSRRERWLRRTSFGAHHWRIAQRVHQHRPSDPRLVAASSESARYLRDNRRIYETQQGGVSRTRQPGWALLPCARSACPFL